MEDFCEDRHKVLAYVPTAVAPSLREIYIRGPKEKAFTACLFKAELSEANALIEHCLVLCFSHGSYRRPWYILLSVSELCLPFSVISTSVSE